MKKTTVFLGLLFFIFSSSFAGTLVKGIEQSYTDKNDYDYLTTYVENGKMKMDIRGAVFNGSFYFNQATSQVDWADNIKKNYYEFTQSDLSTVRDYIKIFTPLVQKSMAEEKNPKKKADMEKLKRSFTELTGKPMVPTARGVSFQGFICDKYETIMDGVKSTDSWLAKPAAAGMPQEDFAVYQGFWNLFLGLASDFMAMLDIDFEKVKQLPYFQELPITAINYVKGKPKNIFRILSVQPQTFAAGTLDLPVGYTKLSFMDLMKQKAQEAQSKPQTKPKAKSHKKKKKRISED